jgi:hypothetical protein
VARREFWQNKVPIVGKQDRASGGRRYWTLEFKGETDYRLI